MRVGILSIEKRKEKHFGDGVNCVASTCKFDDETFLPEGINRLCNKAICSARLMPTDGSKLCSPSACDTDDTSDAGNTVDTSDTGKKVKVAAFDFDGTCLNASSPKKLVETLSKMNLLSIYKIFRIGLWGIAYKLNIPADEKAVRERVFSAFKGVSVLKANGFLFETYQNKIDKYFRRDAEAAMIAHLEEGHAVVLISASFEPIVASAMLAHPIPIAIASRMKVDEQGRYSGELDGLATEGSDKVVILNEFLNEYYGAGNWELEWAYSDHISDVPLLDSAKYPCAVTPDSKLKRYAQMKHWPILDWQE